MSNKVVDWGAEIKIEDGKRPDWLETGVPVLWRAETGRASEVSSDKIENWGLCRGHEKERYAVFIRLPADHPHYRNVEPQEPPLPPEWAMLKALSLMEYGGTPLSKVQDEPNEHYEVVAFARYISQHEEPPVDPDLLEARQIEYELCKAQDMHDPEQALRGEWDDNEGLKGVLKAIKRGRELERQRLHDKGLLREVGE